MEELRSYRRRGTPDFPVSVYWGTAGVNMKNPPNAEYHPEPEIGMVNQGSVTMQIGGSSKKFAAGDIFIIPPNTIHRRTDFSDDAVVRTMVFSLEAIWLPPEHFFQKEFVQPLSQGRLTLPPLLQPGHPAYETIATQFQSMILSTQYTKDFKQKRFGILINICLALMPYCRIISEETSIRDPGNETVRLCMRYIHDNYRKKLQLEALARRCHLHPNYLCAVFKRYTGETVFEYCNRFRVEMAKTLLRRESLPVSKIAELSGFRSECQFFQKFKEYTGMTPKAYARSHKA